MITAVVQVSFIGTDNRPAGLSPGVSLPISITSEIDFSNGVGADAVNIAWAAPRTFTATTDVLDLTSGAVVDEWGTAVVAARVKGVIFKNTGVDAITIGGGSDPWITWLDGTLGIPPGGWSGGATPDATAWPVTAGTACNVTVTGTVGQTYQYGFLVANA